MIPTRCSLAWRSLGGLSLLAVPLALLVARPAWAQPGDPSKVTLKTSAVAGSVSIIEGVNGFAGGNVAVSVGNDGLVVIDDEIAPMTAKLRAAVAALSTKPVRFVINTHWHADHTGGNAAFGSAGAVLIAHDNTRKRLTVDQVLEFAGRKMSIKAQPPEGLPVVTFGEDVTLHLNGDELHVFHSVPAHTDGDAVIHFRKANVIHMGDTFIVGYPVVDFANGGSYEGLIENADRVLAMCDENTRLIPGHGPVSGRDKLRAWRDMLTGLRDRVAKQAAARKTLDEIKAAKPTADYEAAWAQGPMKGDQAIEMVYRSLPQPADKAGSGKRPEKAPARTR